MQGGPLITDMVSKICISLLFFNLQIQLGFTPLL